MFQRKKLSRLELNCFDKLNSKILYAEPLVNNSKRYCVLQPCLARTKSWIRNKYCSNHLVYPVDVSLNDFWSWLTSNTWLVTADIPQVRYSISVMMYCVPQALLSVLFLFCCGSSRQCLYASGLLKGFPRIYVKLENKIHYEVQCLRAGHLRILCFLPKHSFWSSNHLLFMKDKQKMWLCLFMYLGEGFPKDWTRQSRLWYTASNLLGILLSRQEWL